MVKTAKVIESLLSLKKDIKETDWRLKLDCNENIFGVSKFVLNALKNIDEKELSLYTNIDKYADKFCEKHKIKKENILFTDKKNYALTGIIGVYIDEDDEFLTYNSKSDVIENYVKHSKGILKTINYENDFVFDKNTIIENITEKAKIVYITTPDDVCGRLIKASAAECIIKDYPEILFVIDCSYINYSENAVLKDYTDLAEKYDNIVILKSYSSDYALAGLGLCLVVSNKDIISELKKLIPAGDVSALSFICAFAAENDTNKLENNKELLIKNKELFIEGLTNAGYKPYESCANFIICDFFEYCDFYYQKFINNGIVVKNFEKKLPYSSCLRITVPTEGGVKYMLELTKKKEVLIFNPDGIIFDVKNSYILTIAKTVEALTGVKVSIEKIIKTINSGGFASDVDIVRQIAEDMFFSRSEEEIIKTFKDILLGIDNETGKRHIDNTKLILPLEKIEELSKKYDLVLTVNHNIKEITYLLKQNNADKFFSYISFGDIGKIIKHVPAVSFKLLTTNADDVIKTDTSVVDVIGVAPDGDENEKKAAVNNFIHLGVKYILNDIKLSEMLLNDFE